MRKFLIFLLLLAILISLPMSCFGEEFISKDVYTFLILGHDHAAANTDVILLLRYVPKENSVVLLQIPRDTYYDFGNSQNKINQIYPTLAGRHPGIAKRQKALQGLSSHIEQMCGLSLDGYMSLTLDDVARIVDEIGGIEIELPCPITYTSPKTGEFVTLMQGKQHLMGEEAIQFVRYRKGYLEGDIGRIDAQKQFMWAVFSKVMQENDAAAFISLARILYRPQNTNIALPSLFTLGKQMLSHASETKLTFLTLPGQSVRKETTEGLWYYAVCRAEALRVMQTYFKSTAFDPQEKLNSKEYSAISAIYHAPSAQVHIWHHEDILKLNIKTLPSDNNKKS